MRPATCLPSHCFCEAPHPGIAQPANAWSSLSFVLVACLILLRSLRARPSLAWPLLYAFILIFLGLGSWYYHASLSFTGQFLDVLGMCLLATFAIYLRLTVPGQIFTTSPPSRFWPLLTFFAINTVIAMGLYYLPFTRRYLFAALILVILIIEVQKRKGHSHICAPALPSPYLTRAIFTLLTGFILWILDITHIVCWSNSLFQGHAVWHMAGALATWYLFRHLSATYANIKETAS